RRTLSREMRSASEQRKGTAPADWVDIDVPEALRWMEAAGAPTLIHGHTHRPAREALAPGRVREVLSDWELDGHHGPPRAEVLRLDRTGMHRIAPVSAPA